VNNVNGEVDLKNIGGSVVAHALNGHVVATFNRIDPQKPMAFSSLNGDIDVTFPPDLKANVSLRTDNGEVFSDFDIKMQPTTSQQTVEDDRGKGGKYRVKVEKTMKGTINGGGQEIQVKNFNGNIYIRKTGAKQYSPSALPTVLCFPPPGFTRFFFYTIGFIASPLCQPRQNLRRPFCRFGAAPASPPSVQSSRHAY